MSAKALDGDVFLAQSVVVTTSQGLAKSATLTVTNQGILDHRLGVSRVYLDMPTPDCTARGAQPFPCAADLGHLALLPTIVTGIVADPVSGYVYAIRGTLYRYRPDLDTWERLNNPPPVGANLGVGGVYLNGKLYFTYQDTTDMTVYDISSQSWSIIPNSIMTANIATDQRYIYLTGTNSLQRLDPITLSFDNLAPPLVTTANTAGGFSHHEGYLYRHAGTPDFDRYNIATNTWERLPDLPGQAILGSAITGSYYFAMGGNNSDNLYIYDIKVGAWQDTKILPFPVFYNGGMGTDFERVYFARGDQGTHRWGRLDLGAWLTTPSSYITSVPGIPTEIPLNFDTLDLAEGIYQAHIRIDTDSAIQPQLNVPVTFVIGNGPAVSLSSQNIDFGQVALGGTGQRSLVVTNLGGTAATVSDISADHPDMSASPTSFALAPEASQNVTLTYAPQSLGSANATLIISGDFSNELANLAGSGVAAPMMVTDPVMFNEAVLGGIMASRTLTLNNTGAAELTLSISVEDPVRGTSTQWLQISSPPASLPANSSAQISLTFDATSLGTGDYDKQIRILSNDPLQPDISLPVHLYVPCTPGSPYTSALTNWGASVNTVDLLNLLNISCP